MKTNLMLILSFISVVSFAQMRGGMGRGHRGNGNSSMQASGAMQININKLAGLIVYDEDKLLKKLKIKKEEKARKVKK